MIELLEHFNDKTVIMSKKGEQHTHIRNQEILDYMKVPGLCHV